MLSRKTLKGKEMPKILKAATFLIPLMCAPGTLPDSLVCSKGHAERIQAEPSHILISLRDRGDDESKVIAAIWRRILLRIPDVRLVDDPAKVDLEIFVAVRQIHGPNGSLVAYVWHTAVVENWVVVCEGNKSYYVLEQPKEQFMNYAATEEKASEMIQKSVNGIEDAELQAIREMKRR